MRSSKDPFIAAQRPTEGTMDFGVPGHMYLEIAYVLLLIWIPVFCLTTRFVLYRVHLLSLR